MKTSLEATSLVLAAKQLTSRRRDVPLGLQPAKRVCGTCEVNINIIRLSESLGQSAPRLGPASQ
jgi:autonomous glycyl radical cofactor GrcA